MPKQKQQKGGGDYEKMHYPFTSGKNILLEKANVMRELSVKFPRNKMKKVYSIIANQLYE